MFALPLLLLASRASPPPSIGHVVMDDIVSSYNRLLLVYVR
jgi:hypothetical protein